MQNSKTLSDLDHGLEIETLNTIHDTISRYSEVKEVVLFGSRAIGNYRPGSDIDLALIGDKVTTDIVLQISAYLNQIAPKFPYKVDVLAYILIDNLELKKHIDECGKRLF